MIRLALRCEEATAREIASRLRGATIETHLASSASPAPPETCDAVVLCESSRTDAEFVEDCLSAGKHILVAAETWLSAEVLASLRAAERQGSAQLAVVNPDHFLPSRRLIRQHLDAGKLGEPGLIRIHRWEPAAKEEGEESPVLPTSLLRDLELAQWLIGKPPEVVFAVAPESSRHTPCAVATSGPLVEDSSTSEPLVATAYGTRSVPATFVQVHLGFPLGGMALIDYAGRLPAGEGYQSLSVIGSAGAAYADDHQNMQLVYRGGRPQAVRVDEGIVQLAWMVQDFVDGLNAQRDSSASVSGWSNVLLVADAVRRSLASRQAVWLEGR